METVERKDAKDIHKEKVRKKDSMSNFFYVGKSYAYIYQILLTYKNEPEDDFIVSFRNNPIKFHKHDSNVNQTYFYIKKIYEIQLT
jgi:hypothetical protein